MIVQLDCGEKQGFIGIVCSYIYYTAEQMVYTMVVLR